MLSTRYIPNKAKMGRYDEVGCNHLKLTGHTLRGYGESKECE